MINSLAADEICLAAGWSHAMEQSRIRVVTCSRGGWGGEMMRWGGKRATRRLVNTAPSEGEEAGEKLEGHHTQRPPVDRSGVTDA